MKRPGILPYATQPVPTLLDGVGLVSVRHGGVAGFYGFGFKPAWAGFTVGGLNDIDCGGHAVAPFVGPDCDLVRAMLADGKLVSLRGQAGHVGYLLANHPASDRLLRFLREGT